MTLYETLFQPFAEHEYMRRALAACFALALACGPMGVFLLLRRLSLMGDALSHAILPGVAIAFIACGLSPWFMMLGGLAAGLVLTILAGLIARAVQVKEDTSFAGLYLIFLAGGVMLMSMHGGDDELMHMLFGNIAEIKKEVLLIMACVASLTLVLLALMFRGLMLECFDSAFLRSVGGRGSWLHMGFLVLLVLNLVAGFQALGTLMTLGLMVLPALCAGFWTRDIEWQMGLASALAFAAGVAGLLISHHTHTPSGPAIVLVAGGFYVASLLLGNTGSLRAKYMPHHHLEG